MSEIDKEILNDFLKESKKLIDPMIELLESIEGDFSKRNQLEDFGNQVDRIMGGAKSLALLVSENHSLHLVSDYTALCKAVGYKASQIQDNPQFYDVCVAFLLDATETLNDLLTRLDEPADVLKKEISNTFLERLRWISNQFTESFRGTVGTSNGMDQFAIDDLMKKLGLG